MSAPCALLGPGWGEGGVGEWAQLPPCVRPGRSWRWRPRSASLQALRPHLCAPLCPRVSVSLLDLRPWVPPSPCPRIPGSPCLCVPTSSASPQPRIPASLCPESLRLCPCSPGSLPALCPCSPSFGFLHPCHLCTSMSLHPWVPSSPGSLHLCSPGSLHLCVLNPCALQLHVPASLGLCSPGSFCPYQLCIPAPPHPSIPAVGLCAMAASPCKER